MSWHASVLTLFPEMFPGPLGQSLAGRALRDAAGEEWISLPAGTCAKIDGGRLKPAAGATPLPGGAVAGARDAVAIVYRRIGDAYGKYRRLLLRDVAARAFFRERCRPVLA